MIGIVLALLLTSTPQATFHELRCTGVPQYPKGKHVVLSDGQIVWSASAPDMVTFFEPVGVVGMVHYQMRQVGAKSLKGTATYVSTLSWKHQSSSSSCTIVR